MKEIGIGLLGLGVVGSGVVRLLEQNRDVIELKTGSRIHLRRVLVRDPQKARAKDLPPLPLTDDPAAVLTDPAVDIVVELLGGVEPARQFIVQALRAGKHVVTANKDVIAEYGQEVFAAAEEGGTEVFFEASVGGGIPIIRPLKDSLAANHIQSIMGIVNGTTNYILTKMTEEGLSFEVALKQAQELGYAEPDPTNDVQGFDAARKVAILASIGFLSRVRPSDVYTEGITRITPQDIRHGERFGWTLKLLGIAKEQDGQVEVRVHPAFIARSHPLANVRDALNAIFVRGDAVGETMFFGHGAGAMPTASSVVGDIIYAAQSRAGGHHAMGCTCYSAKPIRSIDDAHCRYYVRLTATDQPGVLARVARAFGEAEVNIASVLQTPGEGEAELVLVTHPVVERRLRAALSRLEAMPDVVRLTDNVIRVEG